MNGTVGVKSAKHGWKAEYLNLYFLVPIVLTDMNTILRAPERGRI
ncbi:MAG: hypothetical protein ACRD99_03630 [Nitrososphaera sp.]